MRVCGIHWTDDVGCTMPGDPAYHVCVRIETHTMPHECSCLASTRERFPEGAWSAMLDDEARRGVIYGGGS